MQNTVFISCGQFTDAEKRLGKQITEMVKELTDLQPFFAENVQDLGGLDANILEALRNCVAFITVMHPRGEVRRPDGSILTRASVWIEQEIAVATYIQRVEKRQLPIIAFKHKSVGREGIRDLLQLNPIEFADEAEVLAELPRRLTSWRSLKPSGLDLRLASKPLRQQDGHAIRQLETVLVNDTNNPIDEYHLEVRLPSGILKHFNAVYPSEVPSKDPSIRCFRFDQSAFGGVGPRDEKRLATFEYCPMCAVEARGGGMVEEALVSGSKLGARIFVSGKQYVAEKTIKELAMDAESAAS